MSYVKIWVHAVWGTKNRYPFLTKDIREKVISHIRENAKSKGIFINRLNGHTEHLHALIALNGDMKISEVMMLIKGESSFWINKNKITQEKFKWCHEYYAASVDESSMNRVRAYIENQEEHHRKITFSEEYTQFIGECIAQGQG
ncbi:MAG TPA: IS200/IS605 family transposase [Bacteroidia bacterium]|nr:IS200/IS605 family transposase [Bacteroidia bacterium]